MRWALRPTLLLLLLLVAQPCVAVQVLEHPAFLDCVLDITRCTELYEPSVPSCCVCM
jgi:hypothetical protein